MGSHARRLAFPVRGGRLWYAEFVSVRLTGIVVTFQTTFPGGADGDKARAILPDAVAKSHDRLCTVAP
jgi:putative redox protein